MIKTKSGLVLLTLLAASGCSHVERLTSGVDDPCDTLKAIASDAPSGFMEIRGSAANYSRGRIYQTRTQLIAGHCEIWEWGNGEMAYTCSAFSPSQEVAEVRYQTSVRTVQQCLSSPAWELSTEATSEDGEQNTRLTNADLNVQVRLRMLKVPKPIREEYANYLLVQPM